MRTQPDTAAAAAAALCVSARHSTSEPAQAATAAAQDGFTRADQVGAGPTIAAASTQDTASARDRRAANITAEPDECAGEATKKSDEEAGHAVPWPGRRVALTRLATAERPHRLQLR